MAKGICGAPTAKGDVCQTKPWGEDGLCFFHTSDPRAAETRAKGRQKGAHRSAQKRQAPKLPPLDFQAEELSPEELVKRLNAIAEYLFRAIEALQKIEQTPDIVRALSQVASIAERLMTGLLEMKRQEEVPYRIIWPE